MRRADRFVSWLARVGAMGVVGALIAVGCADEERSLPLTGGGNGGVGGVQTGKCEDGTTRQCGTKLGEHEGVLSCYMGTQRCEGEVWGPCENGEVVNKSTAQSHSPGSSVQALSPPAPCVNNPCDPNCNTFDELPDSGIAADADPPYIWQGGSIGDLPGGVVSKGIKEPCKSGADCQLNQFCDKPLSGSTCAHSKCEAGTGLDSTCDPCVTSICASDPTCCASVYPNTCVHDPCVTGLPLKGTCDTCVNQICLADPNCCDQTVGTWDSTCVAKVASVCGLSCPLNDPGSWTAACVNKVGTVCDAFCDTANSPPLETGECKPWAPGQTDPNCAGIDLALGVPCETKVPVCNHGQSPAPAGLRLIHFAENTGQWGKCTPDQTEPSMLECFTTEIIPAGECRTVDCPNLSGNRELMINPPGASYQTECQCMDNWSLFVDGLPCGAPNCAGDIQVAQLKQVNMYFVIDRSGSMLGTKWTGATDALKLFFQDPQSANLSAALEFYSLASGGANGDGCAPNSTSCSPTPCANPMVPLGMLTAAAAPTDTQEQALVTAINSIAPSGGTPTYPALEGALQWAAANKAADPNAVPVVILVTDGEPTWCNNSNAAIATLAANAYNSNGTRTYTIGMEGANITALDNIASQGGTGQAFVVTGADPNAVAQSLLTAFLTIAQQNVWCSFPLPTTGGFDPNDITVTFTPSAGTPTTIVPKQTDVSGCGGQGWYFDDNLNPTEIVLCDPTCDGAKTDPGSKIQFAVGCTKNYQPVVFTQTYEAQCPAGTKPQWGFFAYDTLTEGNSSIDFSARTANLQADLGAATFTALKTAQMSPTDTQICAMAGPSPCPVDLYTTLGTPDAKYRWLELRAALNPSSNGIYTPIINNWNITYSCPAAE